jgi:hypothetical protein
VEAMPAIIRLILISDLPSPTLPPLFIGDERKKIEAGLLAAATNNFGKNVPNKILEQMIDAAIDKHEFITSDHTYRTDTPGVHQLYLKEGERSYIFDVEPAFAFIRQKIIAEVGKQQREVTAREAASEFDNEFNPQNTCARWLASRKPAGSPADFKGQESSAANSTQSNSAAAPTYTIK